MIEVEIRTIIFLIIIYKIKTDKYTTAIYVIFIIYFLNKDSANSDIYIYIIRKTYIVEDFKIKIFIKINIFDFKSIDIFIFKNNFYIELY